METFQAIFNRHTIFNVRPDPLPKAMVEQMLSAAVQAPNHFKLYPWRFTVVSGAGRERLGDVMAEILAEAQPGCPALVLEKERAKPLRAPVIIVASMERCADPRAIEWENMCAVAAACQNILLAAHDLGLGAIWRTGSVNNHPKVKSFLGLDLEMAVVGFIYAGYPADQGQSFAERPSFEGKTRWIE